MTNGIACDEKEDNAATSSLRRNYVVRTIVLGLDYMCDIKRFLVALNI